jgi:hypothetical protein
MAPPHLFLIATPLRENLSNVSRNLLPMRESLRNTRVRPFPLGMALQRPGS